MIAAFDAVVVVVVVAALADHGRVEYFRLIAIKQQKFPGRCLNALTVPVELLRLSKHIRRVHLGRKLRVDKFEVLGVPVVQCAVAVAHTRRSVAFGHFIRVGSDLYSI